MIAPEEIPLWEDVEVTEVPAETRKEPGADLSPEALLARCAEVLRWHVAPIRKPDGPIYTWLLHDLEAGGW